MPKSLCLFRIILSLFFFSAVLACRASALEPKRISNPIPTVLLSSGLNIKLNKIAGDLVAPVFGTYISSEPNFVFILDQVGIIYSLNLKTRKLSPILEIQNEIVKLKESFDERGLLGLAFHPQFETNGLVYTYISAPTKPNSDFPLNVNADHQSVITERKAKTVKSTGVAFESGYAREVLRIDQPQFNHNGGTIAFDQQGMLLISLGDGGGGGDKGKGHSPQGNGQDPSNPLGSILRIDPLGNNSKNKQYGIPKDNPFLKQKNIIDETWVYGTRNVYRFSVEKNGVYAADLGQKHIEEINIINGGENLGWPIKEGTFGFNMRGDYVYDAKEANLPKELVDPIAEYDHDEGISIIGGFIYKGNLTALQNKYLFGDWLHSQSNSARLMFLNDKQEIRLINTREMLKNHKLLGFAQTASGDILVLTSLEFGPTKRTGRIYTITTP